MKLTITITPELRDAVKYNNMIQDLNLDAAENMDYSSTNVFAFDAEELMETGFLMDDFDIDSEEEREEMIEDFKYFINTNRHIYKIPGSFTTETIILD